VRAQVKVETLTLFSDKVIVVKSGQIAEFGAWQENLKRPLLMAEIRLPL
jgi:hypothetical protein